MRRLAPLLLLTSFLPTCGGDDGPPAKDWSDSPAAERAVDYCLKLAACSPDVDLTTTSRCVDEMLDLVTFPGKIPTGRDLGELVAVRACYNAAKNCEDVRRCVGFPNGNDLDECDLQNAANSCAQHAGVSTLRRCVPAPNGNGGVWLEIDCTKYGLVCGFNEENINLCVSDTCTPTADPPRCDEESGDIEVCGGVDQVTGLPVGAILNEYKCSHLGLSCDTDPGATADPIDDVPFCVGTGNDCDPNAVGWSCDGSQLSVCLPNLDTSTGQMATWDCAEGAIHHVCDAAGQRCKVSASECDPATHPGTCSGSSLTVCVDGAPYTTDCRLHGLDDCDVDANGKSACVD